MVKQKIVIKLSIKNAHKRTKAFKAVAGIHNITSTSIDGDKVVVEGDSIDPIALITVLRKKLCYAELVSVTPVEEKKKEDKNAKPVWPQYCCAAPAPGYGYPCHYAYEVNQYPDHSCSIL